MWVTLREATVRSVEMALNKVLTLEDSDGLSVHRKYKRRTHSRKARWWFILHGSESMLISIEQKWEGMMLQTGWKIEPCFRSSELDSNSGSEPSNSPNNPGSEVAQPAQDDTVLPTSDGHGSGENGEVVEIAEGMVQLDPPNHSN